MGKPTQEFSYDTFYFYVVFNFYITLCKVKQMLGSSQYLREDLRTGLEGKLPITNPLIYAPGLV